MHESTAESMHNVVDDCKSVVSIVDQVDVDFPTDQLAHDLPPPPDVPDDMCNVSSSVDSVNDATDDALIAIRVPFFVWHKHARLGSSHAGRLGGEAGRGSRSLQARLARLRK